MESFDLMILKITLALNKRTSDDLELALVEYAIQEQVLEDNNAKEENDERIVLLGLQVL